MLTNIIEATIHTGCVKGEALLMIKIPIIPTDMPFNYRHLQFPIQLVFVMMTISKVQGQSLSVVGIKLAEPCSTQAIVARMFDPILWFAHALIFQIKNNKFSLLFFKIFAFL